MEKGSECLALPPWVALLGPRCSSFFLALVPPCVVVRGASPAPGIWAACRPHQGLSACRLVAHGLDETWVSILPLPSFAIEHRCVRRGFPSPFGLRELVQQQHPPRSRPRCFPPGRGRGLALASRHAWAMGPFGKPCHVARPLGPWGLPLALPTLPTPNNPPHPLTQLTHTYTAPHPPPRASRHSLGPWRRLRFFVSFSWRRSSPP